VLTAPDLLTLLEIETGRAITTERVHYGERVSALAIPCPAIMRTPEALAVWGPRAFGFEFDYVPAAPPEGATTAQEAARR
jgi:DUF917 family protein